MDNNKNNSNGHIDIGNEEVFKEIDFNSFLDGSDNTELFAGFHADIEKTEQALTNELEQLYDNIMNTSGKEAVPKPISVITSGEADLPKAEKTPSALDSLWMSPDEYIEMEAPKAPSKIDVPEPVNSQSVINEKDDIFSLIDDFKDETDKDSGFEDILSEINGNRNMDHLDIAQAASDRAKIVPEIGDDDFDKRLENYLNGNAPVVQLGADENNKTKAKFIVDTSMSDSYEEDELPSLEPSIGNVPVAIEEKTEKPAANKSNKADGKSKPKKKATASDIVRKIVLAVSVVTIIVSCGVLAEQYIYEPWKFKKHQQEVEDLVMTPDVSADSTNSSVSQATVSEDNSKYPEGMLKKYSQLYDANSDLAGWITIDALEINLPIVKGKDNDYYLHKNIYGKWTMYGVPFFDYRINNLKTLHRNTIVYGHNMRHDDLIFGLLENYREISGFENAPVIQCNTIFGDHSWFVYAVFITNSTKEADNGYVFPYNFIDCSDTKFVSYIDEIDKRKLYSTGIDILETDKILTLSTCCYDFDEARLVVVAREKRENESSIVDTSKASLNQNPKYPQAWYTANKKQNPYADDSRW